MRFFAHDGKTVHGPAVPEELLGLPGFDGDTLVCPVGSENSTDWRPALAYPPFREALLAPAPKLAPPPAPPPPAPAPPPALSCPRCAHPNPQDARFCNACAARMDGLPDSPEPKRAMANAREPAPEPAPSFVELASSMPPSELDAPVAEPEAAPVLDPLPEPIPAPAPSIWRKTLVASFAGAALAGGGLGWWLLRPSQRAAPPVAASKPEAAAPVSPAAPTPTVPAPATVPPPARPAPPAMPAARRGHRAPNAAKRARRKSKESKPAPAGGVMLPGVPRPVSRQSATKPAPAAAPPETADDETTRQVREQFSFCAQLIAQAAYADHFDTCLCADARQAAPYRGRRESYAAALKKAAKAGTLETSAAIAKIALDGSSAKVTAAWKTGAGEKTRTETENWRLEDGLWCRSP